MAHAHAADILQRQDELAQDRLDALLHEDEAIAEAVEEGQSDAPCLWDNDIP